MRAIQVAALVAMLVFSLLVLPGTASAAPCQGPNESVYDDIQDTRNGNVQCGSLTNPCFLDGSSCYGCGPDVLEWIIGPIYCV